MVMPPQGNQASLGPAEEEWEGVRASLELEFLGRPQVGLGNGAVCAWRAPRSSQQGPELWGSVFLSEKWTPALQSGMAQHLGGAGATGISIA